MTLPDFYFSLWFVIFYVRAIWLWCENVRSNLNWSMICGRWVYRCVLSWISIIHVFWFKLVLKHHLCTLSLILYIRMYAEIDATMIHWIRMFSICCNQKCIADDSKSRLGFAETVPRDGCWTKSLWTKTVSLLLTEAAHLSVGKAAMHMYELLILD
jgi:hypothetical protein